MSGSHIIIAHFESNYKTVPMTTSYGFSSYDPNEVHYSSLSLSRESHIFYYSFHDIIETWLESSFYKTFLIHSTYNIISSENRLHTGIMFLGCQIKYSICRIATNNLGTIELSLYFLEYKAQTIENLKNY